MGIKLHRGFESRPLRLEDGAPRLHPRYRPVPALRRHDLGATSASLSRRSAAMGGRGWVLDPPPQARSVTGIEQREGKLREGMPSHAGLAGGQAMRFCDEGEIWWPIWP